MKYGILAALIFAGLVAAFDANAADNEAGFYAGGGVGQFDLEIDNFDDVVTTVDDYDSDDTAYKLFGGWRANKWLALELAYINLGSPDDEILPDTTVEVETDGFAPYIVGTFPIGMFEVFAKAGYFWYDINARIDSPLGTASASDSDSDFTWTAGVGLNFFERFNVRLEYEQFDFNNVDNANALWLTGAFRF
jgi:OOP family OmpA-OmpF porin